jgi:hypothetical protein
MNEATGGGGAAFFKGTGARAVEEWMLKFLRSLLWSGRDDERRHEGLVEDKGRMLEMDEPMAGAGAQLSGEHVKSETEEALERAVARERPSSARRPSS